MTPTSCTISELSFTAKCCCCSYTFDQFSALLEFTIVDGTDERHEQLRVKSDGTDERHEQLRVKYQHLSPNLLKACIYYRHSSSHRIFFRIQDPFRPNRLDRIAHFQFGRSIPERYTCKLCQ